MWQVRTATRPRGYRSWLRDRRPPAVQSRERASVPTRVQWADAESGVLLGDGRQREHMGAIEWESKGADGWRHRASFEVL